MSEPPGEAAQRPRVELFTDGACSGNPGPGGWAFILRHPASGTEREHSGGERSTTNNRMELMAAIEGLRAIKKPSIVDLFSDSQYVVRGLNEWVAGWKKQGWTRGKKREPVQNVDLWQDLDDLRHRHTVRLHWVRGHSEHPENERCDRLAVAALQRFK
ncbi:MAG: ribonuclease HI [Phycisphaerales bacterium]|nr:ribonuclease HI [Phycisphaerales bacterium]